jgi:hypothetical protein
MSTDSFEAPSLEVLAALLPAYDFEAFIAQGGMGAVYKARQRSLDRDVAIKILPPELGEDPEFRQSFETEAKAMARLNHPNLIGVYDYGDVDGMLYIVMEFVNGKSLFHSAYQMAVEPLQAVTIVKGICDGLAHAHENGVIHRDIKPANILLNERVVPKIGDFGLARPAGNSTGIVMGTPGYVAPEVLHHPDHADRRSDLFALGVVLYELLIGRCPPYDYQPPASVVCGCDVTLDRICDKAMNRIAELRYQSAEEMGADLDAWLRRASAPVATQGLAGAVKRPGKIRRVGAAAGAYRPVKADNSSGAVKGILMLAAAVTLVVIGWSKFGGGQKEKAGAFQAVAAEPQPAAQDKAKTAKPLVEKKKEAASTVKREEEQAEGESPIESLGRLRESLAAGKRDEMPKGSVRSGDSHYMVVPQSLSWTAAASFAKMHGAHLFIAKTANDFQRLAALMPKAEDGAEAGLWIGAGSTGAGKWTWVDGSEWLLDAKPQGEGAYVIVGAAGDLQMRERVDRYPFAIQWRRDGTTYAEVPEALLTAGEHGGTGSAKEGDSEELDKKDAPAEVAKLDDTAKSYLEKIAKERDKDLAENARNFTWSIDSWHKNLGKNEQAVWNRDVGLLKGLLKGVRVPVKVGADDGVRLSDKMSKIVDHCAEKQKVVDEAYESKANKARASYSTRMAEQVKGLSAAGNPKGAKAAEARIKKAAELDTWLVFVTGAKANAEGEEEVVPASSPASAVANDISGRWVWMSHDIVLVRPDGSLFNRTNKKKGTWKLIDAGRYEMEWDRGDWVDKVAISYTGNELNGSNQHGDKITGWRILPGDDPLVGPWKWGPAICIFRPDNSVLKGGDTGTWSLVEEKGKERSYTVRWQSGWVDNFSISGNADEFEGTNNNGSKVTGKRVEEE